MQDRPHGSASPNAPVPDRRITDLILEAMTGSPTDRPGRHAADPLRVAATLSHDLQRQSPIVFGTVVHAIPHLNWYRVLTFESGFLGCCYLGRHSALPLGVHSGSVIPPNSYVLVMKPQHLDYGIILGVLPPLVRSTASARPDALTHGGRTGLYAESAHQQPIRGTCHGGGVLNFSCGSPLDATSMEYSLVTETGVAFMLDPFQAYLRVNEFCGLFLNFFDSHARLAGHAMDVVSASHHEKYRNDEGETLAFRGTSVYPWEALGNFAAGGGADHSEFTPAQVQYGGAVAAHDLPVGRRDVRPFHRVQEYGGYLGQGGVRLVAAAPAESGHNSAGGQPPPGLFCEAVGLDGGYLLRSAKSITLVKRCAVPVPVPLCDPESATGDGADSGYRASGFYGGGAEHRVGDLREGEFASLTGVADVQSFLAYACNWKALHPFHYHGGDFAVAEEEAVAEVPDFGALADAGALPEPIPFRLRIDHRYGQTRYYRRESFFVMQDDGSVTIGCGSGARISMVGGKLRLEAPGDLEIVAGGRLVSFARDVVTQAANSVDVTATAGDLRHAAGRNMQSSADSVLIESRGADRQYRYRNLVGEDVVSSGIVLRSAADVAVLGENLYLRSGASGDGSAGSITLDAARRAGGLFVEAAAIEAAVRDGVVFAHGGVDQAPTHAHVFSGDRSVVPADLYVGGSLRVTGGDAAVSGSVRTGGDVAAGGRVADAQGGMIGRVSESARGRLTDAVDGYRELIRRELQSSVRVAAAIESDWRSDGLPGSAAMLRDLHFSYRDDADGRQYGPPGTLLEPRWQQMARLAGLLAGTAWPDGGLAYQGRRLYPWPGRSAWLSDGVVLQSGEPVLYDPRTGAAAPRDSGVYDEPAYAPAELVPLSRGLRTSR